MLLRLFITLSPLIFFYLNDAFMPKLGINVDNSNVFLSFHNFFDFNYTLSKIPSEPDIKSCPLCKITNNKNCNGNSTPRDLVFATISGKVINVFPFIRSLRATGCKATVTIIADEEAYGAITSDTFMLFKNCSVNIYNIGKKDFSKNKNNHFALKHFIIHDYLQKTASMWDRVLVVDLYDTVFQCDPFFPDIDPKALTLVHEKRLFKDDSWNKKDTGKIWKKSFQKVGNMQVLNGGVIYGSPEIILKYETMLLPYFDLNRLDETVIASDQGYMNYFHLSGKLRKNFKPLNLWYRDQGFDSIASNVGYGSSNDLGDIYFEKHKAIFLHMYDRSQRLVDMVDRVCPRGNYDVPDDDYIRRSSIVWN